MRMVRNLAPESSSVSGIGGQGFPVTGCVGLVAVAALLVGDPAELAAIGHADAHLLAGFRHGGRVERRASHDAADVFDQRRLRGAVEMAGQ